MGEVVFWGFSLHKNILFKRSNVGWAPELSEVAVEQYFTARLPLQGSVRIQACVRRGDGMQWEWNNPAFFSSNLLQLLRGLTTSYYSYFMKLILMLWGMCVCIIFVVPMKHIRHRLTYFVLAWGLMIKFIILDMCKLTSRCIQRFITLLKDVSSNSCMLMNHKCMPNNLKYRYRVARIIVHYTWGFHLCAFSNA